MTLRDTLIAARAALALAGGATAPARAADLPPLSHSLTRLAPQPAPALKLKDLDGKLHDLASLRGKVVLINFWATWCPPCKEEMPVFDQLQREFRDRGVQFVGVALDEPDQVRQFLQRSPVGYPILNGDPGGVAWAESLGNTLQVLPFTAVFDRSGTLAQAKAGPFTRDELLELFDRLAKPN